MNISVIGCGRWGSFIAWYLGKTGHNTLLYGREGSQNFIRLKQTGKNDLLTLNENVFLSSDIEKTLSHSDIIVISINAQGLRELLKQLTQIGIEEKTLVLCMKGLEEDTGKRLSEIVAEYSACKVAVWVGPGHVQDFVGGEKGCMLIDSEDEAVTKRLIEAFSGDMIRFYYGNNLLGNEIGAASKNVIGIASGMLDGANLSSLKGVLISRGTREINRLITAMGGDGLCAYGLSHLGDYGATVFSQYSHNRMYGEKFIKGEDYGLLAEGVYTAKALVVLSEKYNVELPICKSVYRILFENASGQEVIKELFNRPQKNEE
ncbi:MAG: glycerol-3-phosphate dehydrogenase [Clostridia bacterium]|nr:glycerol-3-phosphate dehydrogenase [Clostridia bacterium]